MSKHNSPIPQGPWHLLPYSCAFSQISKSFFFLIFLPHPQFFNSPTVCFHSKEKIPCSLFIISCSPWNQSFSSQVFGLLSSLSIWESALSLSGSAQDIFLSEALPCPDGCSHTLWHRWIFNWGLNLLPVTPEVFGKN